MIKQKTRESSLRKTKLGEDSRKANSSGEEFLSSSSPHESSQQHHHHTHAVKSTHESGAHLLQVEDLSISFMMYDPCSSSFFKAKQKEKPTIHNLSLSVHKGEIIAVVGASGSGKTLLANAILGLFETNAIVRGHIWFEGELQNAQSLSTLRGKGISLVPQSTNYLNPLMTVGKQVRGFGADKKERAGARDRLFDHYNLEKSVASLYPHELSGGMARRVLLTTALIDKPKLIIADEPTPGLDLNLATKALTDFREFADQGGGVLLITHDIELALQIADRVAVFKDGTVVEETAVANFTDPNKLSHPFTKELWHALPEHDFMASKTKEEGGSC